jgi:Transposase DDE domain
MTQCPIRPKVVHEVVEQFIGGALHSKQIESVAHATVGALHAPTASIAAIGRASARARGKRDKHGIKQVDRMLSNDRIRTDRVFDRYVRAVVGGRREIVAVIDWSDYANSGHSKIAISLVTRHGRATPLVWLTVHTSKLKKRRATYEQRVLRMLKWALPENVRVTVLADRGFGDTALYEQMTELLRFDFVIRFRGCIHVMTPEGESRPASDWVALNGRATQILDARRTARRLPVAAVVTVKRKGMKEPWILATSRTDDAEQIVGLYARRFSIEETFRDHKDWRFGLGLAHMRIKEPARRDRILLVLALTTVIATLLGAAGELLGIDRHLRANTQRTRTHSLFRQGREYIAGVLRSVADSLLDPLRDLLRRHARNTEIFATI